MAVPEGARTQQKFWGLGFGQLLVANVCLASEADFVKSELAKQDRYLTLGVRTNCAICDDRLFP
jgi:hypothetical protein